uniref:RING-type E3 ubiquitin transferase n=1 Tax=Lepisosteus oculatus TaxID=7918 RepID=W5MCF6_LEPOC
DPGMRNEAARLRSFQHWPSYAPVSAADLANAGFYFLGPGDKVRCFCCGGVLRHWVHGDGPMQEHMRHFPACWFILGRNVGNVPLLAAQGSADAVDGQILSQLQRMTVEDQVAGGQPVYPEMEAEDSRLTTFQNWPTGASVQPEVLARAGFFYTGHGDNVKCFYCDGGLRNWEPGDDPWQEHAKWFPRCEFLLQARGRDYVNNIQESYFHIGEPVSGSQSPEARETTSGQAVSFLETTRSRSETEDAVLIKKSPEVQSVLQMGFDPSLVGSLVQTKYLLTGNQYTSVSDLVSDILQAEEDDREETEQTRGCACGAGKPWLSYNSKAVCCRKYFFRILNNIHILSALKVFRETTGKTCPRTMTVTVTYPRLLNVFQCDHSCVHENLYLWRDNIQRPRQGMSAGSETAQDHPKEKVGDMSPEEELRQLQEERTCKVCMDKVVSIVFIPCGHLVVCTDCAASLRHCPICRAVIRGSVRAFMS